MGEFLVPKPSQYPHRDDPYTESGARSILRRFNADAKAMLREMKHNYDTYQDGKTMLKGSPLEKKIWVAAAMKTMGLVEEKPTRSNACALVLTQKALDKFDAIQEYY